MSVLLLLLFPLGCCLVADTVPETGSTIAGFENETNILVQCKVFDGGDRRLTEWLILKENDENGMANLIGHTHPEYTITGDPVISENITLRNNLTLVSLTADFDRAVLVCGTSQDLDAANFTLRIYRKFSCGVCMVTVNAVAIGPAGSL